MIQGNAVSCNKDRKGTGVPSCIVLFKQALSILLVTDPRWKLTIATDTFDAEYIQAKVQDGTFVPFLNTKEFVNNTPDPTRKEYQSGERKTLRNGKPDYSFEFDNGPLWHSDAYSYNGGSYGVLIVDKSGNVRGVTTEDGLSFKAPMVSDFNTRTYVDEAGDETAKTIVEIQIRNEEEFNRRPYIITAGNVGMDINEDVLGIIDVDITAVGAASVANGVTVKVMAEQNTSWGVRALTAASFRVMNVTDDEVEVIDAVVESTSVIGQYAITFDPALTLAKKIVVELYDATATPPVAVAKIGDNQFFKGASAELTVGA